MPGSSQHVDTIGNPFLYLWNLGYRRLCPIIPPGAELSPRSYLHKRLAAGDDARGKAPGRRGPSRSAGPSPWSGFDWVRHESTALDCASWHEMGAGAGIKLGGSHNLIAVDIDVMHKDTSVSLYTLAQEMLAPHAPVRFGRKPKVLLLFRCSGPVPYDKVRFETVEGPALVEILTEGRQFVAFGTHPGTGRPYEWHGGPGKIEDLPEVTPEALAAYLAAVEARMPAAKRVMGSTADRAEIDQAALRGDPDLVAEAIRHLPNRHDDFPTRDDWVRMGYAIKSACGPDHEDLALDLWQQWSARYDVDPCDPEVAEAEFMRMHPPYAAGASLVFEKAELLGGWTGRARAFFGDPGEGPVLTAKQPPTPIEPAAVMWADLEKLPPREWLYGRKILRRYVTFVASPGGVGKTAWTIAVALSCASGKALLHDAPVKPLRVWIYNLEDDIVEMRRRLFAAVQHHGLPRETLDNVKLNSGRDRPVCLLRSDPKGGAALLQPDYGLIVDAIRRERIDLFIADPFLRTHAVKENATEEQDEAMRHFANIGEVTGSGIILVHHFRKGGQSGDAEALRGSVQQGNSARVVLTMAALSAEEAVSAGLPEQARQLYVRVDNPKRNMSPPIQHAELFKLESFDLGNATEDYPEGDNVQVAAAFQLPGAFEGLENDHEAILAALERGHSEGVPYSQRANDERWAGNMLQAEFGRTPTQAKEILRAWIGSNLIEERPFRTRHRNMAKGLYVNRAAGVDLFD